MEKENILGLVEISTKENLEMEDQELHQVCAQKEAIEFSTSKKVVRFTSAMRRNYTTQRELSRRQLGEQEARRTRRMPSTWWSNAAGIFAMQHLLFRSQFRLHL